MITGARPILFLGANTPWVYSLAQALSALAPTTAVRMHDWANWRRLKPQWPETTSAVRRVSVVMPQGYAGTLEPVFRPLMRAIVGHERSRLLRATRCEPVLICPYPYLAPWTRSVRTENLVYYNLDEYPFYEPVRAQRVLRQEAELVARARLTVCLSMHQVQTLHFRNPASAAQIRHLPLGVADQFLNPSPDAPPLPATVGYIGNLSDRVDWMFVSDVANHLPDVRFHIVGSLGEETGAPWQRLRARALSLPNVVFEGSVPQDEVRHHYWRYSVNWMPYDQTHGFNIASCPTKIMDALASGRPFLSTDIPEVRHYPDRIRIVSSADEATVALRSILSHCSAHDAAGQVAFASTHTWRHRALQFLTLLNNADRPLQQDSNIKVAGR